LKDDDRNKKNLYLLVSKRVRIMEGVYARSSMGVPCVLYAPF